MHQLPLPGATGAMSAVARPAGYARLAMPTTLVLQEASRIGCCAGRRPPAWVAGLGADAPCRGQQTGSPGFASAPRPPRRFASTMAKDGRLVAELSNEVAEADRDYSVPIQRRRVVHGANRGSTAVPRQVIALRQGQRLSSRGPWVRASFSAPNQNSH